jgi:hypothetical protein
LGFVGFLAIVGFFLSSFAGTARPCRDVVRRHKRSGHHAERMSIICATLGKPTMTIFAGHIARSAQANHASARLTCAGIAILPIFSGHIAGHIDRWVTP